jgi:hypothetical protein
MSLKDICFSWCNEGVAFNAAIHAVPYPDLVRVEIEQAASEYAAAKVVLMVDEDAYEMPAEQWCHISVRRQNGQVVHLFHGRVDDYPLEISVSREITLEFVGELPNALELEQALLEAENRQAPYYNILFVPPDDRDKPVPLLEGRGALVDWDRTTLQPRLSDVLQGRSLIEIEASEHDVQGFSSKQVGLPIRRVTFSISVQWHQLGVAKVQIGPTISALFGNAPDGTPTVSTLTGASFQTGFNGLKLPDGYSNGDRNLVQLKAGERGLVAEDFVSSAATVTIGDYPTGDTEYDEDHGSTPRQATTTRNWYGIDYTLNGEYRQKRREVLSGVVDVPLAGAGLSAGVETLTFALLVPTEAENGSVLPSAAASFFRASDGSMTAYGREALEHVLARISARMAFACRSIESTFRCAAEDMLAIDCDTSVKMYAPQLRGGHIEGKVLSYRFVLGHDEENVYVTLGSSRGDGTDTPAGDHLVDPRSYRNTFGADATCNTGLSYDDPALPAPALPVDVDAMLADPAGYLVGAATVQNTGDAQDAGFAASSHPDEYLIANPTAFTLQMRGLDTVDELLLELPGYNVALHLPRHTEL